MLEYKTSLLNQTPLNRTETILFAAESNKLKPRIWDQSLDYHRKQT